MILRIFLISLISLLGFSQAQTKDDDNNLRRELTTCVPSISCTWFGDCANTQLTYNFKSYAGDGSISNTIVGPYTNRCTGNYFSFAIPYSGTICYLSLKDVNNINYEAFPNTCSNGLGLTADTDSSAIAGVYSVYKINLLNHAGSQVSFRGHYYDGYNHDFGTFSNILVNNNVNVPFYFVADNACTSGHCSYVNLEYFDFWTGSWKSLGALDSHNMQTCTLSSSMVLSCV